MNDRHSLPYLAIVLEFDIRILRHLIRRQKAVQWLVTPNSHLFEFERFPGVHSHGSNKREMDP